MGVTRVRTVAVKHVLISVVVIRARLVTGDQCVTNHVVQVVKDLCVTYMMATASSAGRATLTENTVNTTVTLNVLISYVIKQRANVSLV